MATAETQSNSSVSSDATLQRALSDHPEYVTDANSWGSLTSYIDAISGHKFNKTQRTYRIGAGPRDGDREPVDIVLPGTGSLYCLIEWDGNESAKESAVRFMDRSDDSSAVIYVNSMRIGLRRACLLRHGDHIVFGTDTSKKGKERGSWPSEYHFDFHITLRSAPAKGVYKHYDMLHELGRGSFSTVMKALSKTEGLWYAVKLIPVHHMNLPVGWEKAIADGRPANAMVQKLLRESMILKDLRHKNICRLRQVFFESQQISLVLELVEGGDLLKYLLQNKKAMTEIQAGHIVHQICDALAYIHRQNIAHRDLKLENILLTVDDPPIVKVADFGLAKVVGAYSNLHSWCGTGYYLAPEVLEGHGMQPYTQVVDSWSVGIIAFILLSFERQPYVKVATGVSGTTGVTRRVNWQLLERCGTSAQCKMHPGSPLFFLEVLTLSPGNEFLHGLLEHDPLRRTTMESAFRNRWLCAQARACMARPTSEDPFPEPFPELSIPMLSPYRRPFRACRSAPASQSIRWAQERTEDWAVTQEGNQPRFASTALATMSVPIGNDIARVRLTYRPDKRKAQDGFGLSLGRIAEWGTSGDTDVVAPSLPTIATEPPRYSADWRRMSSLSPATKKPRTVGGVDTIASVVYDVWDDVPPLLYLYPRSLHMLTASYHSSYLYVLVDV
ncbi:hypothetical protein TRAPUB_12063 [Trametes pubescens]|uniref:Protein kinase domain-containing protein n=1 Tax=Trametes pubescens TaxID=154538 RepID=A0A1M2VUX9_TRAPU|nr:hypothetical protein TRAPUB_12063 [Trametes pubescens]